MLLLGCQFLACTNVQDFSTIASDFELCLTKDQAVSVHPSPQILQTPPGLKHCANSLVCGYTLPSPKWLMKMLNTYGAQNWPLGPSDCCWLSAEIKSIITSICAWRSSQFSLHLVVIFSKVSSVLSQFPNGIMSEMVLKALKKTKAEYVHQSLIIT